jgi:long-chain fatty acid transport protein
MRAAALAPLVPALLAGLAARPARASNPLEYPDNGAAAFARGGAWLATANEPIAAHYNPAALATQASGMSLDLSLVYNKVCYVRKGPGNQPTGPTQGQNEENGDSNEYQKACNQQADLPRVIPSLAFALRPSEKLGLGFALVPPSAYGGGPGEWPEFATARSNRTGELLPNPAPYRYMTVGNRSLLLMPTFAAGYEIADGLRVGAGLVWGVAMIDVATMGISSVDQQDRGDHATEDSRSHLRTNDFFVPGVIVGAHYSLARTIDLGFWARWLDAVQTSEGRLDITGNYYSRSAPALQQPAELCTAGIAADCPESTAVLNEFGDDDDAFQRFRYVAVPPELRLGVRFHQPRDPMPVPDADLEQLPARDPLTQDVWDVELDLSYTMNGVADTIEVRFASLDGKGVYPVRPTTVNLPPRADRPTGFVDSFGARLGGQYNVVAGRFAVRVGSWIETQAVEDAGWLNVYPVPGLRGGYGGGIVWRQGRLDFSVGYQRHWNRGLDNEGEGKLRAGSGVVVDSAEPFQLGSGAFPDEQQFRSFHTVNGGRVSQSANVISVGGAYRF